MTTVSSAIIIASMGSRMFEEPERASKTRLLSDTASLGSAALTLFFVFLANALWSAIGPTAVAVFSALVQTGITTRLVLLCLFFAGGFGAFAFRTSKQVWYGHVACVIALVTAWNMIARLAIQIQAADVVALAGAGYVLVRGFVNIQEGHDREQQAADIFRQAYARAQMTDAHVAGDAGR
jgi:hypothetical protein